MSLIELFEYLEQNKLITLVPLASNTGETSIGREKKANSKRFCRRTIIINSSLHVTVANLMFYITLFKVTLLDVFNYLKSNLNLKLLPSNSGN